MIKTVTSQEGINAAVLAACDTFRGSVDPASYKDYVLAMLFLKYISDVWQDHHDAYQAQYGETAPELVAELLKTERFVLPASASFKALHAARFEPGNGERIDQALHAIEDANIGKLRDVFQDISFNASKLGDDRQKNELLRHLLENFARPELSLSSRRVESLDVIGNAFEHLIKQFASGSGKTASEFYTPPEISELIARLMEPKEGDDICDPTCGSASLLVRCGRRVRQQSGSGRYALYGQETIGSTWAVAKMNLYLHGEDNHRIEWGDVIRNPKLLDGETQLKRFDVVVANPPFSPENWGYEAAEIDPFGRFDPGVPPRTKGDYGFILHMIESMKPGTGRMAVVAPLGVLFRGASEWNIRKRLVELNLLDAVISLPEKLFYRTGIAAVLLIFRRTKADEHVLFINASRDFEAGKNQNSLREEDLQRIVATVQARRDIDRYARLATSTEIADNDFNLNILRYVNGNAEGESISIDEIRRERLALRRELASVQDEISNYLGGFELDDLDLGSEPT